MESLREILNTFVFWSAWIIIPLIMEIIPSIGSVFLLEKSNARKKTRRQKYPDNFPEISVIVPVYNSETTLHQCIESIVNSSYPERLIRVFLVNNGSHDGSFNIYKQCQDEYPDLHIQWMNSEQGKSRALNMALYNSSGKYIINIDSDGVLEKNALRNLVTDFEENPDRDVMTGSILTKPYEIKNRKGAFLRLICKCEFMEYAQAFLAGRTYNAEINSIYTISGAFSAFRKSAVLKSRMYNTSTISEDTQLTFQMRYLQHEKISSCSDALFLVDPIESMNKLYVQRQRWQRGSLEVSSMFRDKHFKLRRFFNDPSMRNLLYDHTFAFPRMIWYLALILLTWLNYSGKVVLLAFGLIFALYIAVGYIYYFVISKELKPEPELRSYYRRHWWVVMLLPFYNLMIFFIRFAGIINSIHSESQWRTRDLSDEKAAFKGVVREDVSKARSAYLDADGFINSEAAESSRPAAGRKKMQIITAAVGAALIIAMILVLRNSDVISAAEQMVIRHSAGI